MTGSTVTTLKLLRDTELLLRRQLQMVDESGEQIDPNMYTQTQPENEENSQSRGRTVLTILYLVVLGLCFVVPVFYYFRLHCFEENARRELELDFTTALEQSEQHREESRAARRKYIEERRARIIQLLGPVRMVLKEENFPHLSDPNYKPAQRSGSFLNLDFESEKYGAVKSDNESVTMTSEDVLSPYTSDDDEHEEDDNATKGGVITTKCEMDERGEPDGNTKKEDEESSTLQKKKGAQHNPYGDEDTFYVRIPVPGLPLGGSCLLDPTRLQRHEDNDEREMRSAPGLCTICLSNYKVGSDIVWSSNEACDHHFHFSCIEKWLMKQREGPLCPCCRRDFIVDPLDLLEEEDNNENNSTAGDDNDDNNTQNRPPVFSWDPTTLDDDPDFGPIIVAVPGDGAGDFNYSASRLEEGLQTAMNDIAVAISVSTDEDDSNEGQADNITDSDRTSDNTDAVATDNEGNGDAVQV